MGDLFVFIVIDVEVVNYCYLIGVVGGIVLFNFLMMVFCWMFLMVIVFGNMFILKLFEWILLLIEKLVEFFEKVGFLKGVFNVVYGVYDVVNGIFEYFEIKVILFVGFKLVGEYVYKKGSENLKCV